MAEDDPAQHQKAIQLLVRTPANNYERDFQALKTVISQYARIKQLVCEDTWREMNRADFQKFWEARGRSNRNIKLRWDGMTKARQFKKGLAFTRAKETWVYQRLPREMKRRDILQNSVGHSSSSAQQRDTLREVMSGDAGVALPSFGKNIFGGLFITLLLSTVLVLKDRV